MSGLSSSEVADIYQRYGLLLQRRSRLLLRDDALAKDAVHELVTILMKRGGALREAESPYRWLCRAVDRVCLDLLRRNRRSRQTIPLDDVDPVAPGCNLEERRRVLESLQSLDSDSQALAIMTFVDGMNQGEVASELGVSRVTVNKRLQLVRSKLRLELGPTLDHTMTEVAP